MRIQSTCELYKYVNMQKDIYYMRWNKFPINFNLNLFLGPYIWIVNIQSLVFAWFSQLH